MKHVVNTLVVVIALLLLYVALYYALVVPSRISHVSGMEGGRLQARRNAEYRFGGNVTATIFGPMHGIDSELLRPGVWLSEMPMPKLPNIP